MSLFHGASVVQNSVDFHIDFSNPKSIDGTSLRDISHNKMTISLVNSAANTMSIIDGYAEFIPATLTDTNHTHYNISNSYFNSTPEITLETVMYVYSNFGNNQAVRGVSPRVTETGSALGFSITSTGISAEANTTTGWKTVNVSSPLSGYNKWLHITQTSSTVGNSLNTYINGTLVSSRSLESSQLNGSNGLLIGRGWYGGTANYHGRVSYVKVYGRALTTPEIVRNFEAVRGRYGI